MSSIEAQTGFALDVAGVESIRRAGRADQQKGLEQAATQFEAMFLHRMLESMRQATPRSDLLNSQQSQFYESLFDQQLSVHLAGKGFGLAEELIAQLKGNLPDTSQD